MRILVVGLALLLAGCTVFEHSPEDVQKQLTEPTKGQLYVPEPVPSN